MPGYPDRILSRDDAAVAVLKKRTLTNLHNARPPGSTMPMPMRRSTRPRPMVWGDDWRVGPLADDEILARLFALNPGRAGRPSGRVTKNYLRLIPLRSYRYPELRVRKAQVAHPRPAG